jgi:hypothetical protein
MARATKANPRIIDANGLVFLSGIFFSIISVYTLPAQQTPIAVDSSAIPAGGISRYLTTDKFSNYFRMNGFDLHEIELRYPLNSYQTFLNQSLSNFKINPFTIDYRESSCYVPVMVRDELNLIMNRPKDSAFVPILGVAWIAYQLASRYLEIRQKNIIDHQQLLKAHSAMPVLFCLWQIYPQTAGQLYHNTSIQSIMTFKQLQEKLHLLQENNLIKSRFYSPDSIQYFPNLLRIQVVSILETAMADPQLSAGEKTEIQSLQQSIPVVK